MTRHISPDGKSRNCSTESCPFMVITLEEHKFLNLIKPETKEEAEASILKYRKVKSVLKTSMSSKIKTAYRETSTTFGIKGTPGITAVVLYSSDEYLNKVIENQPELRTGERAALEAMTWKPGLMPTELEKSIRNNFLLGQKIRGFYYKDNWDGIISEVRWCGDDTTVAPADVIINGDLWSLKEDSNIIKNGSAGNLMKLLTGNDDYPRGFHALNHYAPEENTEALRYAVSAYKKSSGSLMPTPKNYDDWNDSNNYPLIQRKDFKRWVEAEQKRDPKGKFSQTFEEHKNNVNDVAGKKIVDAVNFNQLSAGNLLSIDKEYYYAKTDKKGNMIIGLIPSAQDIDKKAKVTDVSYASGKQLDILIKYENDKGEELETMNEIRYSHGQFIGSPEAKMKIKTGNFTDFVK